MTNTLYKLIRLVTIFLLFAQYANATVARTDDFLLLNISKQNQIDEMTPLQTISHPLSMIISDNLELDYYVKPQKVILSKEDIVWRYKNRKYPYMAPPVTLSVKANNYSDLCSKIAKANSKDELCKLLLKNDISKSSTSKYVVTISPKTLPLIKENLINSQYSYPSYELFIDLEKLKFNNVTNFLKFFSPFIDETQLFAKIQKLLKDGQKTISLKDLVFPRFAKENYNSFSHFHGPNCFHAALSFNQYGVENNYSINYKIESKLNYNFINNYEFFNALHTYYRKIDYKKERMKFGDVITFYSMKISPDGSNYKSFKHGSVYIGNGYIYTKGSKFSRHPYRIARFVEDYNYWSKKQGPIGMFVFRLKR